MGRNSIQQAGGARTADSAEPGISGDLRGQPGESGLGAQSYNRSSLLPPGMPRAMILYEPMEVIVTPQTTYLALSFMSDLRRIYTDGRDWPAPVEPSSWAIPSQMDRYGEGRPLRPARGRDPPYQGSAQSRHGIPLHQDNMTVVKEEMYLDKDNPDIMPMT